MSYFTFQSERPSYNIFQVLPYFFFLSMTQVFAGEERVVVLFVVEQVTGSLMSVKMCSPTGVFNLISPECVTPPRLLNTALRGGVTNFVTFTCLHHANNANVK